MSNNFIFLNNFKKNNYKFTDSELKYNFFINNNISLKISIILLLIFYFRTFKSRPDYNLPVLNYTLDKLDTFNIINTNSLYKYVQYPQISILIYNVENFKISNDSLLKFINTFREQTLKDIDFFFFFNDSANTTISNELNNLPKIDKRIKLFPYPNNLDSLFSDLKYNINGKFIMIVDKYIQIETEELKKCYNFTKGKIQNIFKFLSNTTNEFYLIKSKLIRDLIDEDKIKNELNGLINYINQFPEPQLNYISIAISPNNYYTIFTYVLMISILSTKEEKTYISFYLILSKDFEQKNIDILLSLYEQFDLFNITFIYMDDRYKNAFVSRRMTQQTYFRFSLGEILPHLNKIIYLDSDTIVYKDLSKFYNLNFNGKLVLGQVTGNNKSKQTGIFRINNGILLLNLLGMRKEKMEEKALKLINERIQFYYHDQTLMNDYFKEYIGIFPPEFHVRNWNNFKTIQNFNNVSGNVYENDILFFASKYPTIRHYLGGSKPVFSNKNHIEDWWYFARKSKYYRQKATDITKIFEFPQ